MQCAIDNGELCEKDIAQCFENREGRFLQLSIGDQVPGNEAWFVSFNNRLRKFRVVFLLDAGLLCILSVCEADEEVCQRYDNFFK